MKIATAANKNRIEYPYLIILNNIGESLNSLITGSEIMA